MPARTLDGEAFASQIHRETASRVAALTKRGITPRLVFIRVGEDPASRAYVSRKESRAKEVGISSTTLVLPQTTSLPDLLRQIDTLNADPKVHGILIQSPLPQGLPNDQVYARVSPSKDVDGFHPVNFGKLLLGDPTGFLPCTPAGILEILRLGKIPTRGKHAVIVGRGQIVGRPPRSSACSEISSRRLHGHSRPLQHTQSIRNHTAGRYLDRCTGSSSFFNERTCSSGRHRYRCRRKPRSRFGLTTWIPTCG